MKYPVVAAWAALALASQSAVRAQAAPSSPAGPTLDLPPPPAAPPQLHGIQYLYGSGEAAALTRQSWRALVGYVREQLARPDRQGVVLAADATLAKPGFVRCAGKPPAVILDVDETALLNLVEEYDDLLAERPVFDDDVWIRWEKTGMTHVAPTPGARAALDALRAAGVTVIFNTNRNAFDARQTEQAIANAGLGPAVHGKTLFLAGDDAHGSMKDGRRQSIAARYCVLAMAGDQLVDFSDHFDFDPGILSVGQRRAAAEAPAIAALWGNGWFMMPNPVYGSGLQGGADDIFPKDKQWRDPGPARR